MGGITPRTWLDPQLLEGQKHSKRVEFWMGRATQILCEHVSANGELMNGEQQAREQNFYQQHKIFNEYSCHINQLFSI